MYEPRKTAAELRRSGQDWHDIARILGCSVPEAKEKAEAEKAVIRTKIAHSFRNEEARGLHSSCEYCGHIRKDHEDYKRACEQCEDCEYFTGL